MSTSGLSETVKEILRQYPVDQIGNGLSDHPVRRLLCEQLPQEIRSVVDVENLVVHGSEGKGTWTSIPWVAVRNPQVSSSIQEGYYVVYLFEPQKNRVFLTLNQGVKEIKDELGTSAARKELRERAKEARSDIQPKGFTADELEFEHASNRNQLYGPGTIFYREYSLGEFPDDGTLKEDLKNIVSAYREFTDTRHPGAVPEDHFLTNYYRSERENISVWKFASHGDDYPTILQHGAIQFTDDQLGDFEKIDEGDLVLFYVTKQAKNSDVQTTGSGLIGGGIVTDKDTKNESWWWNEFEGEADYRNIVLFDELHVTGDLSNVDLETSIEEKDNSTISNEVSAIKEDRIDHDTLNELSENIRGRGFPVVSVLTDLHVEENDNHEFVDEVLKQLTERTSAIPYERDEVECLGTEEKPSRADDIREQLTSTGQVVFHGPPGTGKTFTARRFARWWLNEEIDAPTVDHLRFVTFHPSFSYEDFIEGLTAKQDKSGTVTYEIEDGVFKQICKDAERAYNDAASPSEAPPYVLVIDEINRGNLAKIFGETITQLEQDKRLGEDQEITVELAHSGEEFAIPPNLYVIGTMNTADRSIALVDAALRRRFSFLSFPPNYDIFGEEYEFTAGLADFIDGISYRELLKRSICALQVINKNVLESKDLGKGKQVGHSYLLGLETRDDIVDAWKYNILPLLEEYYFGELRQLQESLFETEDCGLFDNERQEIADFDGNKLAEELDGLLDRTTNSYTSPR